MMPEHLSIIEFVEDFGGTEIEYVAMFNSTVIHPSRVESFIKHCGASEFHNAIVFMSKKQYENLKDREVESVEHADLLEDLIVEQQEQM